MGWYQRLSIETDADLPSAKIVPNESYSPTTIQIPSGGFGERLHLSPTSIKLYAIIGPGLLFPPYARGG